MGHIDLSRVGVIHEKHLAEVIADNSISLDLSLGIFLIKVDNKLYIEVQFPGGLAHHYGGGMEVSELNTHPVKHITTGLVIADMSPLYLDESQLLSPGVEVSVQLWRCSLHVLCSLHLTLCWV